MPTISLLMFCLLFICVLAMAPIKLIDILDKIQQKKEQKASNKKDHTDRTDTSILTADDPVKILEQRYTNERRLKDSFYEKLSKKFSPLTVIGCSYEELLNKLGEEATYYEVFYYFVNNYHPEYEKAIYDIKVPAQSKIATIAKTCLDDYREISAIQTRTKLLHRLNNASYLTYVEDMLTEVQQYLMTNLRHIVNYLVIDGCLENFENDLSQQGHKNVATLMKRNQEIIQRSKELLHEATVRLVNGHNNSDEAMTTLTMGIQSIREIIA